jgi:tetratricopeptide (TPR) repeat protein
MNDYLIQFALLRERAFYEPNDRDLFRQLLICMELIGNHADSRDLYTAVLDEHPYCCYAWYNLGWACAQLGESEEALEAFEYAYITQPYFEEAYRACAELAVERGLHQRALQCYIEMNAHAEANSEVLVRMAECYRLLGDNQRAKKLCKQALQLEPCFADAFFQLGACFIAESDYQRASWWLREAIRASGRREEFHSLLAVAYGYLGKPQKALHHLWKAVELAPDDSPSWLRLAEFLLFAGDLEEASEVLEQALENTSSVELLYCRAACQFLSGARILAASTLQQALAADVGRHMDIFRWAPTLRDDAEVLGLLSTYR